MLFPRFSYGFLTISLRFFVFSLNSRQVVKRTKTPMPNPQVAWGGNRYEKGRNANADAGLGIGMKRGIQKFDKKGY